MRVPAALSLVWLLIGGALSGQEGTLAFETHPLAPPDTSSPSATLDTFIASMNKAWELFDAGDPRFRVFVRAAERCLDVGEIPPNLVRERALDSVLLLKEVLDRVELPPSASIPGSEEVLEDPPERWRVPNTEIDLRRVEEGERKGEYLFAAETVDRVREFYDRVRDRPYQPGKSGAHYDELRFSIQPRALARLIADLPQWTKREYDGQLVWQWAVLLLLLVLSVAMVGIGIGVGRRLKRSPSRVGRFIGPLLGPILLVSLQRIIPPLAPWPTQLGGPGVVALLLVLQVVAYFGWAWLIGVVVHKGAALVVRLSGADERPLHRQLILMSARAIALVAMAIVLFRGGQSLGIPLSALVTGLGVGGLAVALSAQSTLENLIGGINLFADRPVRIGDFCRFGDQLGVVEAIGLRSTRIRTLGRTVVSIPNSSFARMELENLSLRDRNLLRTTLHLEYGTGAEQVEGLLSELREAFSTDERVASEPLRIRLLDLGRDALEIEIFAYLLTNDWDEYLGWREELLLRAMRIVDAAGLRLALPSVRQEVVQSGGSPLRQPG